MTRSSVSTVPVVLLGTSGHAREIAWIAESNADVEVVGCLGPRDSAITKRMPAEWLGEDGWLDEAPLDIGYMIGIGDGKTRHRIATEIGTSREAAPVLVHAAAVIGLNTSLGEGSVAWPGAVATTDVVIGRHVHLTTNCAVGHDAVLDDFATLLPGSTVGGFARIGLGATVGAGASVLEGIQVGAGAMVGAGALVREHVPPGEVVVGVPARPIRTTR